MNNKIGELIEKYRKEKGLTQSELAKKLGVSNTAISKWEHGNNLPDITLLEPLSEILGIDKLVLFTSENEIKEETSERVKQLRRKSTIKLAILSIIFIFTIVFTNYISYKVYKHKLDKIESSQSTIYKFNSTDPEFVANGYLILNEDGSNIIFEQFEYQKINQNLKSNIKSEEYKDIELIEIYITTDKQVIFNSFYKKNGIEQLKINDFFKELSNSNFQSNEFIEIDKIKNIKLMVKIETKDQHVEKEIILNLSTEI